MRGLIRPERRFPSEVLQRESHSDHWLCDFLIRPRRRLDIYRPPVFQNTSDIEAADRRAWSETARSCIGGSVTSMSATAGARVSPRRSAVMGLSALIKVTSLISKARFKRAVRHQTAARTLCSTGRVQWILPTSRRQCKASRGGGRLPVFIQPSMYY